MSNTETPVALYHVTTVENVPWILKSGLFPQIGPIAAKQGEKSMCVHCYTSEARALSAVAEDGDFRKLLVEEKGPDAQIVVFRVFMDPKQAVAFSTFGDNFSVKLMCRIPPHNLQLLNTEMTPYPEDHIVMFTGKYGPEVCEPPSTYHEPQRDTPF